MANQMLNNKREVSYPRKIPVREGHLLENSGQISVILLGSSGQRSVILLGSSGQRSVILLGSSG